MYKESNTLGAAIFLQSGGKVKAVHFIIAFHNSCLFFIYVILCIVSKRHLADHLTHTDSQ